MDYTIKAGDTLSKIAQLNKTDVASIATLNKIQDPNKIIAGSTIKIPTNLTTPTKTDPSSLGGFTVDTSSITTEDTTTPKTKNDVVNYAKNLQDAFTNYQKNMQDYQSKITGYMQPGAEEAALQKEVLGLQQTDRENKLAEQGAVLGLEGQGRGITTGLVRGQQAQLQRQQALEQQKRSMDILAKSESLQALTGIRKTALDTAKEALGFENTMFEKMLGVEEALRGLDKTTKEDARQTLSDILDFSKGQSFEELDPNSQQSIINAVANSPYTLGQVRTALERNKIAYQDEQAKAMKDRLISVGENSRLYDPVSGRYIGGGGGGNNILTTGTPGQILQSLDSKKQAIVLKEGDKFSNSPIVKKFNEIVTAANFINATDKNTENSASHQAVIYNFAKMLDPDSVVREGEYATVKKYSQSLAKKYGGEIKQAVSGKGFLSPEAIQAIQDEAKNRINAYLPQYNAVKKQYSKRIDNIVGKNVGDVVLLDYEEGYVQPQSENQGTVSSGNSYTVIKQP